MTTTAVPTTPRRTAATASAGVHLAGLRKSFRTPGGTVHAVRGIDLDIAPGETVALLGPNGAGKSTTIEVLLGLARADGGTAQVLGMAPDEAVADGRVSAMLQSGSLVHDVTVRELVAMVAALYPRPLAVDEALAAADLTDVAGRRTQSLSGGQAQRVRFAVALVAGAELLVLDEPTVAMDVEARRAFWTTMRRVAAGGTTVIFATHYLEEAEDVADRVVLMAHGRIVADGTTAEVRAMVGLRTIRVTLAGADPVALQALPGVTRAEAVGPSLVLRCDDSDLALRALLDRYPDARDIEVKGAGLEEAFLELTAEDHHDDEEPIR